MLPIENLAQIDTPSNQLISARNVEDQERQNPPTILGSSHISMLATVAEDL